MRREYLGEHVYHDVPMAMDVLMAMDEKREDNDETADAELAGHIADAVCDALRKYRKGKDSRARDADPDHRKDFEPIAGKDSAMALDRARAADPRADVGEIFHAAEHPYRNQRDAA